MIKSLASWRSTMAGVVTFCAVLFGQVAKEFDNDPETRCDWNMVVEAGGLLWLAVVVRDNVVTSERAGAK